MKTKKYFQKLAACALALVMLMSVFPLQISVFAETAEVIDLSALSDENKSEELENYSYVWTVEEIDEEKVKTLTLTLDGANVETLTLPCKDSGKLYIIIDTQSDSHIGSVNQSYGLSYQWDSITFKGEGVLEIENMETQGAGNDHIITISEGANISITGEYASLNFGTSGSNCSTLNVDGTLSVNGDVSCGQAVIGTNGSLICNRLKLSGEGAFDTDGEKDAFVLRDGGVLESEGDAAWYDDETNELYASLFVGVKLESTLTAEEIINIPDGVLPPGYSLYKGDRFATVDDGEEEPRGTSFETGVIYAATSLTLSEEPRVYKVVWKNHNGDVLETDEDVEYGEVPTYDGEAPTKAATAEYVYTFAGWTPDVEEVTEDIEYTAIFNEIPVEQPETYTITFDSNGGSDVEEATVRDGEKLTKPAKPTRSRHTFVGWYEDEELTNEYDFDDVVTSDFVLYAKWKKKSSSGGGGVTRYTVKFDTDGGTDISDKRVIRNSILGKPEDPVKEDYVFDGWYTEETLENPYDFEGKVTKSFTLYAKWRKTNVSDILNTSEHFAYVKGYSDNTVRPENNITRAETTEIFFRLLNEETRNTNCVYTNSFIDSEDNAWYNTSVSTMEKLGIIKGKTDVTFAPDDFITRAEFAAICARFDESEFDISSVFTDISGHWAEAEIYEAAAHGWIKGFEDGTFRPDEFITRAQAITMINRMLDRTPGTVDDLNKNMIKWKDNSDESVWYYIAVQEATNDHSYVRDNNGNEKWN